MEKILKKPYFGFFCHFWLYRSHHRIGNKNADMKNVMKITKWHKILKKSLIFGLKMKKSHIANMRLLQKFVIFGYFELILYIRSFVADIDIRLKKKTKNCENMAILEFFSYFHVIFGFLLPYPYPHQHSGQKIYLQIVIWPPPFCRHSSSIASL